MKNIYDITAVLQFQVFRWCFRRKVIAFQKD